MLTDRSNPYLPPSTANARPTGRSGRRNWGNVLLATTGVTYTLWFLAVVIMLPSAFGENIVLLSGMAACGLSGIALAIIARSTHRWLLLTIPWSTCAFIPLGAVVRLNWNEPWRWYWVFAIVALFLVILLAPFMLARHPRRGAVA